MDSTIKLPLVSIIMPVYNAESFLTESINSILKQTYTNFEFIIVDDCSTDDSFEVIGSFKDKRIIVFKNKKNSGISESLNLGIKNAKGKYIARMDADDISHPSRIEKQISFLEKNKDYVLCASNYHILNNNFKVKTPKTDEAIRVMLLKACCIAHPTVVLRVNMLNKYNFIYKKELEPTEDYNFWISLIKKGKFYNLQEDLLGYRIHENQITKQKKEIQDEFSFVTSIKYLTHYFKNLTDKEIEILKNIYFKQPHKDRESFLYLKKLIVKLELENKQKHFFSKLYFKKYLLWLERTFMRSYFFKYNRYSIIDFFEYLSLYFKYGFHLNIKETIMLFLKSIFFYKLSNNDT